MSAIQDVSPQQDWTTTLPSLNDLFPSQSQSLVKSFSLFSLFKSKPVARSNISTDILDPLFDLEDGSPTESALIKALTSLSTYLSRLESHLASQDKLSDEDLALLGNALKGYLYAFDHSTRLSWSSDHKLERADDIRQALYRLLNGTVSLYRHLSIHSGTQPEDVSLILSETRQALLTSTFPLTPSSTHTHLSRLFGRPRHLIQSLQVASRPIAHSKVHPRPSTSHIPEVTEQDALEAMALLELFAGEIEEVDKLDGAKVSKTKAQKEEDCRRPLRIAMEARVLRCDVGLSMATRDIKAIKGRAQKAIQDKEEDESDTEEDEGQDENGKDGKSMKSRNSSVEEEDALKWDEIGEEALVDCLQVAKALLEERRGGVLSDKVERQDWLGVEPHATHHTSGSPKAGKKPSSHSGSDTDLTDTETESEDDDTVDTYPCPLRGLFRLHDRYEEQRLAVWLSLAQDRRRGMGTYMRGEEGKVGEAWDGLGLLLLLDYDGETLLNHGLSVEKLDKWVELASKRNAKKIRRRKGRKTI